MVVAQTGQKLGSLELTVMKVLWNCGPCTPRRVSEVLEERQPAGQKALAYTTILTTLQRLHQKGIAARSSSGKTHVYESMLERLPYAQEQGRQCARDLARLGPEAVRSFLEETERLRAKVRAGRESTGSTAKEER